MRRGTTPIRVGILHSLTGVTAISETPLADAALLAVSELDEQGGLLGRPVEVLLRDGASNPEVFAREAEDLLVNEGCDAILGCWSSASRKAVKPIVERHDAVLFYPMQYEGLEESPCIVYTGSCLNQQFEPGVQWTLTNGHRSCCIIGSDYVYPRTAGVLVRALMESRGGCVLDEVYAPLDSLDFDAVVQRLDRLRPDIVFNTLAGEGNLCFFRQLAGAGLTADTCPVLSFSFTEVELERVKAEAAGHFACWSYFQTLETDENRRFLQRFHRTFGESRVASDPVVTSYTQVHLWAAMVRRAGSARASDVRRCADGEAWLGPSGWLIVQGNNHVKRRARIGRATADGQFAVVWQSAEPILPKPWLGAEDLKASGTHLIMKALAQYTDAMHLNWQLEEEIEKRERVEEALERRRQVAEALRDVVAMVNSDRPLIELLEYVAGRALTLLGASACGVYRLEAGIDALQLEVARGEGSAIHRTCIPVARDPVSRAVLGGHAVEISGAASPPSHDDVSMTTCHEAGVMWEARDYRAVLAVPLVLKSEVWGALAMYYERPTGFPKENVHLAESLCEHVALAIENERLRERAEASAATEERVRLARDLHDSVSQSLFAANLAAEALSRRWAPRSEEVLDLLSDLQRLTRGTQAEMRALLLEMRPEALERLPLQQIFGHLVAAAEGRSRLKVHLSTRGFCDVPAFVKSGLYRVAQEALNNVVRHSDAQNAWLELDCMDDEGVILVVRDDGRGFDVRERSAQGSAGRMRDSEPVDHGGDGSGAEHMGIAIMHERAAGIGADLHIDSDHESGTAVRIRWPVSA